MIYLNTTIIFCRNIDCKLNNTEIGVIIHSLNCSIKNFCVDRRLKKIIFKTK